MKDISFNEDEILEFVTEAKELLDAAESCLLSIDKANSFKESFDSIFRCFHSIKGGSGMMDMTSIAEHMHKLENKLNDLKSVGKIDQPHADFFLRGIDATRSMLGGKEVSFNYEIEKGLQKDNVKITTTSQLKLELSPSSVGHVLVIDDDVEMTLWMKTLLEKNKFDVQTLNKSSSTLKALKESPPDVVITDFLMPDLNGLEVLDVVRSYNSDIPVILLSGHIDKGILMSAIEKGIQGVFEKPFHSTQMIQSCQNAVLRNRYAKLLSSSINLIMYQFSELDNFLKSQGREDLRKSINRELNSILEQRRRLREIDAPKLKAGGGGPR